jgi:hypothetical protein
MAKTPRPIISRRDSKIIGNSRNGWEQPIFWESILFHRLRWFQETGSYNAINGFPAFWMQNSMVESWDLGMEVSRLEFLPLKIMRIGGEMCADPQFSRRNSSLWRSWHYRIVDCVNKERFSENTWIGAPPFQWDILLLALTMETLSNRTIFKLMMIIHRRLWDEQSNWSQSLALGKLGMN